MTKEPLKLLPQGRGWAVFDGRDRLSGTIGNLALAEETLEQIDRRRRAEANPRPCLCCNRIFPSEGPHNRLCDTCNRHAREAMI
ncbi:MAG: hypothetical protein ACK4LQ_02260 [Pararhodobacter sp.]